MPTRAELIKKRRRELMDLGYTPGIIEKAMDWAVNSAEGMINYAVKNGTDESREKMMVEFLPGFLDGCEKYMQSFDHHRGETRRKT